MASADSSIIENVRIVHAEDELEEVIRKLATSLEDYLKLPGQADYDRQKPPNPDYVNKQLEIAVTMGTHMLFYITDNVLLLYKKKKKQIEALKNLLKKDGNGNTRKIAILWGSTKNKESEKIFGDMKGQLKKIMLENFSHNEYGNVVEAAYKIWQGPDAVLPSRETFTDIREESLPDDSIRGEEAPVPVDGAMDEEPSSQLPAPEQDASDLFKKILKQLRGVAAGQYKAVIVLSSDLIKLLRRMDVQEFERLCHRAANSGSPSMVFLLHNTTLEDVRSHSPRLADIIEHRHHTFEGKDNIDGAAYGLSRFLQDGESLEAVENDENTMCRSMHMEFNHHRDQMISTGEDANIPRVKSSKAKVVSATGESIPVLDRSRSDGLPSNDCPSTSTVVGRNNYATRSTASEATNDCQGREIGSVTSPVEGKKKSNLDVSVLYEQRTQDNSLPRFNAMSLGETVSRQTEEPSNLTRSSVSTTTDERDRAHSLISKSSSSSLTEGSSRATNASRQEGRQQTGRPLQSREPPSAAQTGPRDLTGHPPQSGTGAFPQSPGASQQVPSAQPMGMSYIPSQPNGVVRSNPQAPVNRQPSTEVDPMLQYFKSNPEALSHFQYWKSQSTTATLDPRAGQTANYGVPQHPQSGNHNPVYPASAQSQFQAAQGYPPQQRSAAPGVGSYPSSHAYQQSQAYGPQHMQHSAGVPPMQPASAQVFQQGPVHQHLMHSRSVPEMPHHSQGLPVQAEQSSRLLKLPADVKKTIENKLNIKKVAGLYWRHFAEELGVESDEIGVWDSQNSCNYMAKLFEWIGTHKESYTVHDFRSLADRFKRPDIVRILDDWWEATQNSARYFPGT